MKLLDDTMFGMIGPVFPLTDYVKNRLFYIWYNGSLEFVITSKSHEGNIAINVPICLWAHRPYICIAKALSVCLNRVTLGAKVASLESAR